MVTTSSTSTSSSTTAPTTTLIPSTITSTSSAALTVTSTKTSEPVTVTTTSTKPTTTMTTSSTMATSALVTTSTLAPTTTKLSSTSTTAKEKLSCDSSPCMNSAKCKDTAEGYTCSCGSGRYTGKYCETDIGACFSAPCSANSTCANSGKDFVCLCDSEHTGSTCETTINQCNSSPCQHQATCKDRYGYYECICPPGYTGKNCESEINTCLSIPCQNGATCSRGFNTYSCKCKEKFTGYNCETEITICLSQPCMNNGECALVGGNQFSPPSSFRCDCAAGYKGTLCEQTVSSCNDDPCRNNATCVPTATRFVCTCPSGFTGTYCETNIDDCPKDALEQCVHGQCTDLINDYVCTCLDGYTGEKCETEIDECESSPCSLKDTNSTCLNLINKFSCVCSPEFTGELCKTGMSVIAQADNLVKPDGALSSIVANAAQNNTLAVSSTVSESVSYVTASLTAAERAKLSWSLDQMVMWCTYEERECNMEGHFAGFNDPVLGNCYTFNPENSTRDFKAVQAGEKGGLAMMMNIDQSDYVSWTDVAGIRVFIHDKHELVYPDSVSYTVTPGTVTAMIISRTETQRLGAPFGECTSDKYSVPSYYYPGQYMIEGCLRSCYQDALYKMCGCMDPDYPIPEDKKACALDLKTCVSEFNANYSDPTLWNCKCPLPCNQIDFIISASRTKFRKVPPSCSTQTNATIKEECYDQINNARIEVSVYYANIISLKLQEVQLYPPLNALSDTGGNMGLLFGVSAITMIEFAFTAILALFHGTTNVAV
uniref:EGF-like domain-containing protein n=1 Tax=Plectus sambesii TaxID=2011161 RepID=A0A914WA71_9BILA